MNTKLSVKNQVLNYLVSKDWIFGGTLEREVSQIAQCKPSNISRRCRELEDDGMIESGYVTVPGVANKVVQYRLKHGSLTVSSKNIVHILQSAIKFCCLDKYKGFAHNEKCFKLKEVQPVEVSKQQSMF
jgi:hypothetical protein